MMKNSTRKEFGEEFSGSARRAGLSARGLRRTTQTFAFSEGVCG